ncbi:MAG TPA: sulfite exporter TauE/SafE family protein, partial [Candidatus Nanoarchaeia archaeon]|nr:sulfite exporter TauE/SafE family protein [Candidatus Nanoarchaeia archaeon]
MFDYISFAGLALLLGFKHSYDPDHIIVVANFLREADTLKSAVRVSVSWAVGHMITAAIVTTLLYAFRESVIHTFLANFEKVAGVVLIALGLFSLKDFFSLHSHPHKHEETEHSHPHTHPSECNIGKHTHKHMFGIGMMHGLASNDELLILFTASLGLTTLSGILAGVAIFSIGVVIGMVVFALLFSYPLLKTRSKTFYKVITLITGTASVVYGL